MSTPAAAEQVPLTVMDNQDGELIEEMMRAVEMVARSGAFTGGPFVEQFEDDFARYTEVEHAVGVASGTEALALLLRALGVAGADEVIVPANSFIATAEAVVLAGARPRFADVDEDTQLVTAATVAEAWTPAVGGVIPVHLFGRTVELDELLELARSRGAWMVEDCAQAHGARHRGRRAGTVGDAAAFSFYPAKNLGAWGDAGAVVTDRADLADRVRLLRAHGERPRYRHGLIGTTARLDAIQAAILARKLPRLERWNAARRRVAAALRSGLEGCTGISVPPPAAAHGDHVYHQFVLRSPNRDRLRDHLSGHGVATAIHYPVPIHGSPAFAHLRGGDDPAPVATRLARQICSLPIFPSMSEGEVARVVDAVREFSAIEHARRAA